MTVVAEWNNVTKTFRSGFRTTCALQEFDGQVEEGHTVGLLGEPASGKTTSLHCLLGTIRPSNGSVELFGRSPTDSRSRKQLGYLPEQFHVFPQLPIREVIQLLGELRGTNPPEDELRERKNQLGLSDIWSQPLAQCTNEEQGAVGVLQAFIGHPSFLILDQPTEQLNDHCWEWLDQRIRKRSNQNLTTLIATHRTEPVNRLCDRTIVVRNGQVVESGPTEQVIGDGMGESVYPSDDSTGDTGE